MEILERRLTPYALEATISDTCASILQALDDSEEDKDEEVLPILT